VLGELRERRGATQRDVATRLGVTQPNVWRVEHEEDVYLSSLRDYVAALGGRIEVRAVFDDETYTLVVGETGRTDAERDVTGEVVAQPVPSEGRRAAGD
jgi:transcriptional regulator with XRE-family HTH domain